MRNLKQWKKVLVVAIVVFAAVQAAKAATPIKSWDMSGTPVQKTVLVPTNEPNYPANLQPRTRTVLEDADGDVVLGIWRTDNNEAIHNPSIVNGALEFYGLQSAYIQNGCGVFSTFEKISFEFTPASISSGTLIDFPFVFDIRMEAVTGGTRLTGYWVDAANSASKNVKSSNTLVAGQTYLVEAWIQKDPQGGAPWLYLSLDGVVIDETWTKGYVQLTNGTANLFSPHLALGGRTFGTGNVIRGYSGTIDNIELSFFAPECGDWGYLNVDFDQDCYVGLSDFVYMASKWLQCTHPEDENCIQL